MLAPHVPGYFQERLERIHNERLERITAEFGPMHPSPTPAALEEPDASSAAGGDATNLSGVPTLIAKLPDDVLSSATRIVDNVKSVAKRPRKSVTFNLNVDVKYYETDPTEHKREVLCVSSPPIELTDVVQDPEGAITDVFTQLFPVDEAQHLSKILLRQLLLHLSGDDLLVAHVFALRRSVSIDTRPIRAFARFDDPTVVAASVMMDAQALLKTSRHTDSAPL